MSRRIISRLNEKPKTRIAWWAMGLGIAALLVPPFLGIFASVIRPLIDKAAGESTGIAMGFGGAALALIISISALVVGIKAYRMGERSWVLWLGYIPALLIAGFWIFMFAGELLFPH